MSLLNDASLVLIPSGYKENKVYSIIPSDGSGDMTFVRGGSGTRINSLGQVESVCWNLINDSEDFTFGTWSKVNTTVTGNTTVAPNGTTTADTLVISAGGYLYFPVNYTATAGETISMSVYSKSSTAGFLIYGPATIAGTDVVVIENVGNGWYRHIITRTFSTSATGIIQFLAGYLNPGTYILWGAQLNQGAIKPYFKTTDRQNVPRLTYENGCPSLLLEKQSTNLVQYSNSVSTAAFSGTLTLGANTSPEGINNSFSFLPNANTISGITVQTLTTTAQSYTFSVYLKGSVNGQKVVLYGDLNGQVQIFTLTTNWVRYNVAFTGVAGSQSFYLIVGSYFSPSENSIFYGYGMQLEASAYATSLIPTTSTSVTRLADSCYKTGISSLIGQTEGTIFAEITTQASTANNWFQITDGTANNWIFVGLDVNKLRGYIRCSATTVLSDVSFTLTDNAKNKIALGYKSGDIALYINGTQIAVSSASFTVSSPFNRVVFGDLLNPPNDSAKYGQALLFQRRLTNTELAQLTTL